MVQVVKRLGAVCQWARFHPVQIPQHAISDGLDSRPHISSRVTIDPDHGNFEQGLDYWFFYNDFAHLPWHIKNTWLHVWYELGWIGLILFATLSIGSFVLPFSAKHQNSLGFAGGCLVDHADGMRKHREIFFMAHAAQQELYRCVVVVSGGAGR